MFSCIASNPTSGTKANLTPFELMLLQCFHVGLTNIPSFSFLIESEFWQALDKLCYRWISIMQFVLSFAATSMHLLTSDPQFSRAAIVRRGIALKALQDDIRSGKQGDDATIAASILLADQAALEGDWKACILHHRCLANLCKHNAAMSTPSFFTSTRSDSSACGSIQRRAINISRMVNMQPGNTCYASLELLRHFLSCDTSRPDMSTAKFLGCSSQPLPNGDKQI